MRAFRVIPYLLVGGLALAACEEDDPSGPDANDLEGDWTAQSITYTSIANPSTTFDAIAAGGTLTLSLTAVDDDDLTVTGVFDLPAAGLDDVPLTGTVTILDSNSADVDFNWPPPLDQQPPISDFEATFSLSGDVLTFVRPSTMFDFTPGTAGGEEEARLTIVMER